jgi:peptide/nickel transport system permease protein
MRGLTKEYVLRRFGMFLLTIWLGATLIFIIPRLAPGDPVAAMVQRMSQHAGRIEHSAEMIQAWRERFGLDGPILVQYLRYLGNCITLDFGYSLANFPVKVQELVSRSLPWTVGLLFFATVFSFLIGNTIGALMGWRGTPRWLKSALPLSLTFTSVPFFMLAILLIYTFAFGIKLFPFSGGYGREVAPGWNWPFIKDAIYHAILPMMSIVIGSMGFWALGMRGMMITTSGEDYMILAEGKGLFINRVFWRYAVRNAVLPQVTALALSLGSIVGGSTLVEYVFSYPGIGFQLYNGILASDYTVIQGIVFIMIFTSATAVFVIDLIYPLIDPRITYQKK